MAKFKLRHSKNTAYTFSHSERHVRVPSAVIRRAGGRLPAAAQDDCQEEGAKAGQKGALASQMHLSHMWCTYIQLGCVRQLANTYLTVDYHVEPGDVVAPGQELAHITGKRAGEEIFHHTLTAECDAVVAKLGDASSIHLTSFVTDLIGLVAIDQEARVFWYLHSDDMPSRSDLESLISGGVLSETSKGAQEKQGDVGVFIGATKDSDWHENLVGLRVENREDDTIVMSALGTAEVIQQTFRDPDAMCLFHMRAIAEHKVMGLDSGLIDLNDKASACYLTEENGFLEKVCMSPSHPQFLGRMRFIAGGKAYILVK